MNAATKAAEPPSGLVTVTPAGPTAPGGVAQVRLAADVTDTLPASAPPTVTVAPGSKAEPARVIVVPPATGPTAGATDHSVGAEIGGGAGGAGS